MIKAFSIRLALFSALCGCADMKESTRKLQTNTVRIGGLVTLTGALGKEGRGILYGARLAAREINDQGGVNGQKIELVEEDDQIKASALLAGADELKGLGVQAVLGSVASSMTILAAQEVFIPAGIPMISASSTSPRITALQDNGLVWRTAPSDAYQGEFLANKIWGLGIKKASVLYIDNAYGSGLAARFAEVYQSLGGNLLHNLGYSADKQKDFGSEVASALSGLSDGDAFLILGYASDSAAIGVALEAANPPKLSYWGCDGNAATGFLLNSPLSILKDLRGSSSRTTSGPLYDAFQETYINYTHSPVEVYSAQGYDAIYLMALAMARAGSNTSAGIAANLAKVSGGTGTKVYPSDYKKALELLSQASEIDYSGVSGDVDFDANGDIKINSSELDKFYYIWKPTDDLKGFEEDKTLSLAP